MRPVLLAALLLPLLAACDRRATPPPSAPLDPSMTKPDADATPVVKTDAEWKQLLTPEQYRVLREKGTERAFTGEYTDTETPGVYRCAACDALLFTSTEKFHSGCGWPSFFRAAAGARITETVDRSHGMIRTEITCTRCGGHLGHVFDDGPAPTGLRYCVNSVSVKLDPAPRKAPADGAGPGPAGK